MKQWLKKHIELIGYGFIFICIVSGIIGFTIFLVLKDDEEVIGERYYPQGQYAVLDLGSKNCAPCDNLKPIFATLDEKYGENIDVVVFDIVYTDEGAAVANAYNVNIMPTLLFLDKYGREVKRVVGFRTQEQIEEIFRELGWIE